MRSLRKRPMRRSSARRCVVELLEDRRHWSVGGFNDVVLNTTTDPSTGNAMFVTYPGVTVGGDAVGNGAFGPHTGSGDLDIIASNLPAHTRIGFDVTAQCSDPNGFLTASLAGATQTVQIGNFMSNEVKQGIYTDENWPIAPDIMQHTDDTADLHIHVSCASDATWSLGSAELDTTTFMSVAAVNGGIADPGSSPLTWTISRDAANGHAQNVYFNITGPGVTVVNQVDQDSGEYLGDLRSVGGTWGDVGYGLGNGPDNYDSTDFVATIPAGQTSVTVQAQPTGILWTDPNGDVGGLVSRPVTLQLFTPPQYVRDATNEFTAYWHDPINGVDDDNATVNLDPLNTTGNGVWFRIIGPVSVRTNKVIMSMSVPRKNEPTPIGVEYLELGAAGLTWTAVNRNNFFTKFSFAPATGAFSSTGYSGVITLTATKLGDDGLELEWGVGNPVNATLDVSVI